MLSILCTHNSSDTSVSFRVDFSLFLVQIIKTNCIFLEEQIVCVFITPSSLPGIVSLSVFASSQKPESLALFFWTPATSKCCPLENETRSGLTGWSDWHFDMNMLGDDKSIWKRRLIWNVTVVLMAWPRRQRLHTNLYPTFPQQCCIPKMLTVFMMIKSPKWEHIL